MTIIDAMDDVYLPEDVQKQLVDVTLPNAHKAMLKDGGAYSEPISGPLTY